MFSSEGASWERSSHQFRPSPPPDHLLHMGGSSSVITAIRPYACRSRIPHSLARLLQPAMYFYDLFNCSDRLLSGPLTDDSVPDVDVKGGGRIKRHGHGCSGGRAACGTLISL